MLIVNGAELGGATGAMAPLVFWSQSLKKSRKVSKSKSCSLEWRQLFLPSFGANAFCITWLIGSIKLLYNFMNVFNLVLVHRADKE